MDALALADAERLVRARADRYREEQRGVVDAVYTGSAPLTELGSPRLDQLRRDLVQAGLHYDAQADACGVAVVDRFSWQSHLAPAASDSSRVAPGAAERARARPAL